MVEVRPPDPQKVIIEGVMNRLGLGGDKTKVKGTHWCPNKNCQVNPDILRFCNFRERYWAEHK